MYQLTHKLGLIKKYRYDHAYRYKLVQGLYDIYGHDTCLLECNAKKVVRTLKLINSYIRLKKIN